MFSSFLVLILKTSFWTLQKRGRRVLKCIFCKVWWSWWAYWADRQRNSSCCFTKDRSVAGLWTLEWTSWRQSGAPSSQPPGWCHCWWTCPTGAPSWQRLKTPFTTARSCWTLSLWLISLVSCPQSFSGMLLPAGQPSRLWLAWQNVMFILHYTFSPWSQVSGICLVCHRQLIRLVRVWSLKSLGKMVNALKVYGKWIIQLRSVKVC